MGLIALKSVYIQAGGLLSPTLLCIITSSYESRWIVAQGSAIFNTSLGLGSWQNKQTTQDFRALWFSGVEPQTLLETLSADGT